LWCPQRARPANVPITKSVGTVRRRRRDRLGAGAVSDGAAASGFSEVAVGLGVTGSRRVIVLRDIDVPVVQMDSNAQRRENSRTVTSALTRNTARARQVRSTEP